MGQLMNTRWRCWETLTAKCHPGVERSLWPAGSDGSFCLLALLLAGLRSSRTGDRHAGRYNGRATLRQYVDDLGRHGVVAVHEEGLEGLVDEVGSHLGAACCLMLNKDC